MALVLKNRVQENSTTSGTGTLTLSGAVPGFQTFSTAIGNGNTTYYTLYDNVAQVWEVGIGTVGAGTLARTTVLSNSSGTTSPLTLAGNSISVWCDYPSEKSVYLDASSNVSPLGTIASGTWQGTTVGVSYGGTGVTASSGANSVMLRDANQNVAINRLNQANTNTTASAGTTALTAASSYSQTLVGTGTHTFSMPDATFLTTGVAFVFNNNATGTLTLKDYATATIGTITSGGATELVLLDNSTVAGTWDIHGYLPENVTWGTNALNLGSTVITNGTWNGGTIGTAYGGTGLTTFSAANYALYSTSSSTLVAGTLPVAAGGTGATTLTGYVYGNGTGAFTASTTIPTSALTGNYVATFSGGSTGFTPNTATTGAVTLAGTLNVGYGGTGLVSYTTGDIIYASGTTTLSKLGIGTTNYVLTSSGTAPQYVAQSTLSVGTATNLAGGSANQVPYQTGSGATSFITAPTNSTYLTYTTGGGFAWSSIPSGGVTSFQTSLSGLTPNTSTTGAVTLAGTLGITSGGTGQTTASAAFNALSPITTAGDLILGNGTNSATRLAIGANNYVLTSNGTTATWAAVSGAGTITVTTFTATAGQTTFTVSYTVGLVQVYRNGVKLAAADYTASNGTSIVLATGANVGDTIEVNAFSALNTYSTIIADTFSGNGSTVAFTMTQTPANSASVIVAISGVVQDPSTYTVSGTTLTFSTAPPSGTGNISARYIGLPGTVAGTGAVVNATNGIIVNNATISASYTIPSGSNAMSTGPVSVASGVTVTIPSGSRWAVI